MIIGITRSYVRLQIGDKSITIQGEAFLPGHGSPDFVAYSDTIRFWDPPHEHLSIGPSEKARILSVLKSCMANKDMSLEIE